MQTFLTKKVRATLGQQPNAADAGAYKMEVECRNGKVLNDLWLGGSSKSKGAKGKGKSRKKVCREGEGPETGKERIERLWVAQLKAASAPSSVSTLKECSMWVEFLERNGLTDENAASLDDDDIDIQMIGGKKRGLMQKCPYVGEVIGAKGSQAQIAMRILPCKHVISKKGAQLMLKNGGGRAICPEAGCNSSFTISKNIEIHEGIMGEIERAKKKEARKRKREEEMSLLELEEEEEDEDE